MHRRIPLKAEHVKLDVSLEEAVGVIAQMDDQFKILSDPLSKTIRARWRGQFLPLDKREMHLCRGCVSKGKRIQIVKFEWEFVSEPRDIQYHEISGCLTRLVKQPEELAVFFERCDLPVFVVNSDKLIAYDFDLLTDLYIFPATRFRWTLILTHEQEFGPYIVFASPREYD